MNLGLILIVHHQRIIEKEYRKYEFVIDCRLVNARVHQRKNFLANQTLDHMLTTYNIASDHI